MICMYPQIVAQYILTALAPRVNLEFQYLMAMTHTWIGCFLTTVWNTTFTQCVCHLTQHTFFRYGMLVFLVPYSVLIQGDWIHQWEKEEIQLRRGSFTSTIPLKILLISNDPRFRRKHPCVPDGSDGSDGTWYPLTENYTLPVALHWYLLYFLATYTHHQNDTCVTLFTVATGMLKPFFLRPPLLWKLCWCTLKS